MLNRDFLIVATLPFEDREIFFDEKNYMTDIRTKQKLSKEVKKINNDNQ